MKIFTLYFSLSSFTKSSQIPDLVDNLSTYLYLKKLKEHVADQRDDVSNWLEGDRKEGVEAAYNLSIIYLDCAIKQAETEYGFSEHGFSSWIYKGLTQSARASKRLPYQVYQSGEYWLGSLVSDLAEPFSAYVKTICNAWKISPYQHNGDQ